MSGAPTGAPTGIPTGAPTGAPTGVPTGVPTGAPVCQDIIPTDFAICTKYNQTRLLKGTNYLYSSVLIIFFR